MASVEMRLTAGGVRELHWHVEAEWAIMLNGNARITAVEQEGKAFVSHVGEGDLSLFPPGVPHSIQGLRPDGCRFLLVFDDGNFDEFHTFLLTEASAMQATKLTPFGEVKIIDWKIFPVIPVSAAIVTLQPGGLREPHWHPNADE
jgi:oxalate decarboxylase/phosphoglucose isomerase-like protein (cupin superfamily)